jgi:hypothetical protein
MEGLAPMSPNRVPERYFSQLKAQIVDYQGRLAYTWGWNLERETPTEERLLKVSKIKVSDWPELVDLSIENWQGEVGEVYIHGSYKPIYVRSDDFKELVTERRPFPKPRDGKDRWGKYTWKWNKEGFSNAYWEKIYIEDEEN